jgi:two-component system, cell cycle sensor histidine kinase and response regulator CckA
MGAPTTVPTPAPEALLDTVFRLVPECLLLVDPGGGILDANPAACSALGRSLADLRATGLPGILVEAAGTRRLLDDLERHGAAVADLEVRRVDGTGFAAALTARVVSGSGTPCCSVLLFRDLAPGRNPGGRILGAERMLRMVMRCNEALLRARGEQELFQAVCRVIVEEGGYRMCWVGVPSGDESQTVRPVAHAGHEDGYLALAAITWRDEPRGRGPTGTALREGRVVVAADFATSPNLSIWREEALKRGYGASIAVPIVRGDERFGVLTMYSHVAVAFGPSEVGLLRRLADDLAFAVTSVRQREARDRAVASREAALATLSREQARFQALVEHATDLTLVTDPEGIITFASPSMRSVLGFDPAEMVGRNAMDFVHPDDLERVGVELAALLQGTAKVQRLELRILRADGGYAHLESIGAAHLDVPAIGGIVVNSRDVTSHREVEAERERLALAIEQAAETVVITDPQGIITYVNPAFEKVTGYSRTEALGQNPRILKSGIQDQGFYRGLWDVIVGGETWHGRLVNRRKDGTHYTEDAYISPIRDDAGAVQGYVAVKRDITKELDMETRLLLSQKLESVGRLAGGVAHDFNNLLTVILYAGDHLRKLLGVPGDPGTEDVEHILTAARRATGLTRQLLAFARRQVVAPRVLDVNQAVHNGSRLLRRVIGENVELVEDLPPLSGAIRCDPGLLDQVLMNLVLNARDAMPGGGTIRIATANVTTAEGTPVRDEEMPPGHYVRLSIRDTGSGMTPDVLAHVFEPFFTTKAPGTGTGLGLATVYGIVKQSGAYLDLHSEVGRGTELVIFFPRVPVVPGKESPGTPAEQPSGSETVLVVEDEAAVRSVVARALRSAGYAVLEATEGREALALLESSPATVQLLVSDVVMPGMGGIELARRVAEQRPGVRVLLVSGYVQDAVDGQGKLEGAASFLAKPFTTADLLTRVRELLARTAGAAPGP